MMLSWSHEVHEAMISWEENVFVLGMVASEVAQGAKGGSILCSGLN